MHLCSRKLLSQGEKLLLLPASPLESSLCALESAEQRDTGASYCLCGTVLQAALLGTISKYL